jgi:hypothetical protein
MPKTLPLLALSIEDAKPMTDRSWTHLHLDLGKRTSANQDHDRMTDSRTYRQIRVHPHTHMELNPKQSVIGHRSWRAA